ncbi:thermonuclease family protein [Mesoflavibacter zeaxanthinifaciens]|uniref:thermonuclease family protein n=1 Tax=Mesoflavibacter zeaxanthinifaciens TaxID=393060 RepID=UPI003A926A25
MFKYYITILFIIFQSLTLISDKQIQEKEIHGKIVGITDGDTVKLLTVDKTIIKVRVANIDCPERKQPYSARAKQFTSNQIFEKQVKLEYLKKDRYGRYICNIIYDDSLNLSKQLLKNGMAWHYVKYSNDESLQMLENEAKKNKEGLWQDPTAVPPWEWRSSKRN